MKKYVYIQSETSIMVTAGLQNQNVTNKDAHVPDRLAVNADWPKLTCFIKRGKHTYPAIITTWKTVKALERDGILTIGAETDTPEDEKAEQAAKDLKIELDIQEKKEKKLKEVKDISLESMAK